MVSGQVFAFPCTVFLGFASRNYWRFSDRNGLAEYLINRLGKCSKSYKADREFRLRCLKLKCAILEIEGRGQGWWRRHGDGDWR
jgi:hypothetical protein